MSYSNLNFSRDMKKSSYNIVNSTLFKSNYIYSMTVLITSTSFFTYWKPIWISLILVVFLVLGWNYLRNNVDIESNDIGEKVLKIAPYLIYSVISIVGVSLMNAKTFDFDTISRTKNNLFLSHKKWLSYNQTVLDMKDIKTIKKCRMSIPGVKKAMVLQIVLTNEVYTSEVIKDVESVSKNLSRNLHLQFSSGELCEYRE